MKKIIVILIAILYVFTSMGMTVRLHYCMDKLVSTGFANHDKKKSTCDYCGMPLQKGQKKSCCKEEYQAIKNTTDQKKSLSVLFDFSKKVKLFVPVSGYGFPVYELPSTSTLETYHAPPYYKIIPLFIQYCNYII